MIYHNDLVCPLCQHGHLTPTYIPSNVRYYRTEGEEVCDHIGESCDIDCPNCGFQFTFHVEQQP